MSRSVNGLKNKKVINQSSLGGKSVMSSVILLLPPMLPHSCPLAQLRPNLNTPGEN